MSRLVPRPENALKRANELLVVDKKSLAIEILHESLLNRRIRAWSPAVEEVMMLYIDLSIDLRESRRTQQLRDALTAFRAISQSSNPSSVEKVIDHLFAGAEKRFKEAFDSATAAAKKFDQDLDEGDTPETIMMGMVTSEDNRDRSDRTLLGPSIRFLWDAYKMTIEILKNNSKLESLYHSTARRLFKFCREHGRRNEFQNISKILRFHLEEAMKQLDASKPGNFSINLKSINSLRLQLDTRLEQLDTAIKLESWSTAFSTVENLHSLLPLTRRSFRAEYQVAYYRRLASISLISNNYLAHAFSSWRIYQLADFATEAERQDAANKLVLATLAIPASRGKTYHSGGRNFEHEQLNRLTLLLMSNRKPSRAMLLRELSQNGVIAAAIPQVQQLYTLFEVDFHPLSMAPQFAPISAFLAESPELAPFLKSLQEVLLGRLLFQLSLVYDTMKLSALAELAPFFTADEIEAFLLAMCRSNDISLAVDHVAQSIRFKSAVRQDLAAKGVQAHMLQVAQDLAPISEKIRPSAATSMEDTRAAFFDQIRESLESEHSTAINRKEQFDYAKDMQERKARERMLTESRRRIEEMRLSAEAERVRVNEESTRRELERLQAERDEAVRQSRIRQTRELEARAADLGIKLDLGDVEDMSAEQIMARQLEQLNAEKAEIHNRLSKLAQHIDYQVRALRLAEVPILKEDFKAADARDLAHHEAYVQRNTERARELHAKGLQVKSWVQVVVSEVDHFKARSAAFLAEIERQKEEERRIQEAAAAEQRRRQEELQQQRLAEQQRAREAAAEALRIKQEEEAIRAKAHESQQLRTMQSEQVHLRKLDTLQRERDELDKAQASLRMASPTGVGAASSAAAAVPATGGPIRGGAFGGGAPRSTFGGPPSSGGYQRPGFGGDGPRGDWRGAPGAGPAHSAAGGSPAPFGGRGSALPSGASAGGGGFRSGFGGAPPAGGAPADGSMMRGSRVPSSSSFGGPRDGPGGAPGGGAGGFRRSAPGAGGPPGSGPMAPFSRSGAGAPMRSGDQSLAGVSPARSPAPGGAPQPDDDGFVPVSGSRRRR
ncbi:hypothetical protein H696_04637 [Fonticula alba]|uniref:PCI domain-containing protein n=1 Tax=Fonticula alba TaxID=691883 RepID=A0A058Z4M2_FONAL|nr:hypothetical protein H696_04637 [Fonticula alba]KCV69220.1 hypothetical protein H696_04637 [Fonticula alba]|eukprot:XP_009496791.1 hypothetical protein H696_04637 [Fonticula alba]